MTTLEKHIVKFIDNKYSFPYLHYNKLEQTWEKLSEIIKKNPTKKFFFSGNHLFYKGEPGNGRGL